MSSNPRGYKQYIKKEPSAAFGIPDVQCINVYDLLTTKLYELYSFY